jgi:ribosome maturation factor RimP
MPRRHEELSGPLTAALEAAGYELVAWKLVPRGPATSVEIFIDHLSGRSPVTLEDCSRASRAIQDGVDLDLELHGRYVLEVSSPGVDRPLTRPEHYQRFQGEEAVVRLRSTELAEGAAGPRLHGRIGDADAEGVTLELPDGTRERLRYEAIESARLKIDPWKRKSNLT